MAILWSIMSALGMTVVSLINDGYNVDVSIKLLYSVLNVFYCSYYLYVAATSKSTQILNIFGTGYSLDWRSVATATLFNVIVFLIKQIYNIIKRPNKFSSIICYFPVIGIESVEFSRISKPATRRSIKIQNNQGLLDSYTSHQTPSWLIVNNGVESQVQASPTLNLVNDIQSQNPSRAQTIQMTELQLTNDNRHQYTANDLGLGLLDLPQSKY